MISFVLRQRKEGSEAHYLDYAKIQDATATW